MRETKKAVLVLEDGTTFEGKSFGYEASTSGEVVFNTAMTGYPESLTDPSYEGQILVTTYPILGNYGVPPRREKNDVSEYYESDHIHCKAIVAQDYSWEHSHWQADRSLADWLKEEHIPGIYGIDTRELTKHLREHGSMLGKIIVEGSEDVPFYDPNAENLVAKVSCDKVEVHGEGEKTVVLVDCGVKHNIIRCLTRRGVKVIRVPWNYDFTSIPYNGLFISNGPGNPDMAAETVDNLRKAMAIGKPICGICMGNQLL
ncbi:carbamoyl phosphate synthase small subunit, partial [uncultured Muribaculum sp.]